MTEPSIEARLEEMFSPVNLLDQLGAWEDEVRELVKLAGGRNEPFAWAKAAIAASDERVREERLRPLQEAVTSAAREAIVRARIEEFAADVLAICEGGDAPEQKVTRIYRLAAQQAAGVKRECENR